MSCGCDNKRLMEDLSRARSLARKAARMEGRVYVVYRDKAGSYRFCAEGDEFEGELVEHVWY